MLRSRRVLGSVYKEFMIRKPELTSNIEVTYHIKDVAFCGVVIEFHVLFDPTTETYPEAVRGVMIVVRD